MFFVKEKLFIVERPWISIISIQIGGFDDLK